jgi:hypothetical protein
MSKYNDQDKSISTVKIGNKTYKTQNEIVKGGCQGCIFINRGCTNDLISVCRTGKIFVK